jgi:hypothetical protein
MRSFCSTLNIGGILVARLSAGSSVYTTTGNRPEDNASFRARIAADLTSHGAARYGAARLGSDGERPG